MKRVLRKILLSCVCLFTLMINVGCACSKPMVISFTVTSGQGNKDSELTSLIGVIATVEKKFREPANTPCYRKMSAGKKGSAYVELINTKEKYQCYGSACYKKSDDNYVALTTAEISKCIEGSIKCYEKVEKTYYKLLEEPEGISKCYTKDGIYFERATYDAVEKLELSKNRAISTKNNLKSYTSNKLTVPSEKNYSLIYTFKISNEESHTIYVEAIDFQTITNGNIKEKSYSKIKITQPTNMVFINNKYYYQRAQVNSVVLEIKIQNLLNTDSVNKSKELNLNIPIIVK